MSELPDTETAEVAAKRRLVNRVVIVALFAVGLLGTWVMFDAVYAPPPTPAKTGVPGKGKPAAAVAPQAASPVRADAPAASGAGQYALQMGVFDTVGGAEELRAKLERHGIPSGISIEARVQVGPFATREGADAAQAKLKELGLEGGSLLTLNK